MKTKMTATFFAMLAVGTATAEDRGTLVENSGVKGGVVVHLGCGYGQATANLHSGDRFLIYGLDENADAVEAAKGHIASKDVYGQVSAETYDGKNLPFGDNIVNLVVVEDAAQVTAAEIKRVLVPKGMALVKSGSAFLNGSGLIKAGIVEGWGRYRKPWPADIDEWPQFLYDSSNNAVSRDRRVGKPRHLQWFAGPRHTRDHDALASMSAMTSSDGRVFYIFDEGPTSLTHQPADWKLIARDAFNGKLLWKRNISSWMTHLYNFRAGPVQLPRRLVSVGDKVYATLSFDVPVQKLDGATGKTLMTYEGSGDAEEMIWHDGMLLVVKGDPGLWVEESPNCHGYWDIAEQEEGTIPKQIVAYHAETGKLLWQADDPELKTLVPLSLCAQGEKVFYLDGQQLHCLNAGDGKEVWAAPFETSGSFLRAYAPTVVAHEDVIMCLHLRRGLQAFSVETGKRLWKTEKASIGFASPGDVLVKDGKAWLLPMDKSKVEFNGFQETVAVAIDIHTGEVAKTVPSVKNQHHHRCFRNKATARGIIMGYSGVQIFDWEKGSTDVNQWVRGVCQYGMMPANGLLYVPPDPCRCYSSVKLNGFCIFSETNSLERAEIKPVLEKGPEYGRKKSAGAGEGQWPSYRGGPGRYAVAGGEGIPGELSVKWEVSAAGPSITAPVVAGGMVYMAERDAYTVQSHDAETGEERWRYLANGPVDSPPTVASGFCVFGCGDGSVYCLTADDGGLVWRFKVSALERRIGSDDRLESPWPVNGSVLIVRDTVYFSAGRSSHLFGGIRLFGLDLETGNVKCSTVIQSRPNNRTGALPDILICREDQLHMRNVHFDYDLNIEEPAVIPGFVDRHGSFLDDGSTEEQKVAARAAAKPKKRPPANPAMTSGKSLLDGAWFHRTVIGAEGQIYAKNDNTVYTVITPYTRLKGQRRKTPQKFNQTGKGYHQKYTRYETQWFPVGVTIKQVTGRTVGWSVDEPIQPRAILLAGDRLYLAGWEDGIHIEKITGRVKGGKKPERANRLWVYSAEDGMRLAEYPLSAEPVWDGIAAARGRLYVALKSGQILCLGEESK